MSLFARIFRGKSGGGAPNPEPLAAPPQPQGEWNILVDRDCCRITSREARPGDMMARRPSPYRYGGTVPGFKPDSRLGPEENIKNRIDYEIRAANNRQLLEQAVFILSQTDDGKRLLNKAYNDGFTFAFDPRQTAEQSAAGLCDYNNRQIPLAEGYTAAQVALTVKHELQHMEDITNGAGRYSAHDTLASATIADRGLEANARVSEAVFAVESLLGSKEGPPCQFRTYAIMGHFHNKNPAMGNAALNARLAIKNQSAEEWAGFGNAVFPAYYKSTDTLAFYDERLAKIYADDDFRTPQQLRKDSAADKYYRGNPDAIESFIRDKRKDMEKLLKDDTTSAEDLARTLCLRGRAYLKFDSAFNPASKAARGITAKGLEAFARLAAKLAAFEAPLKNPDALKNIPKHEASPPPKGLPKEFAAAIAGRETAGFEPFILPHRLDGDQTIGGETSNANATKAFTQFYDKVTTSTSPLDKIEFAVTDWCRNCGTMNIKGKVDALLKAGLRAPINAFPSEYLHDLARRIRESARYEVRPSDQAPNNFSHDELQLIAHWKEMDRRGLSPLWVDDKHKQQSLFHDDREKTACADIILKGIGHNDQNKTGPTSAINAGVS